MRSILRESEHKLLQRAKVASIGCRIGNNRTNPLETVDLIISRRLGKTLI
jgi:hypothetical protein